MEIWRSEDTGIEVALAHETEVLGTAAVLGRSYPFEVSGRVVGNDPVDVVTLVSIWSRTMEGKGHEDVAVFTAEIAHAGIRVTTLAVMAISTRSTIGRAEIMQHFLPVGIHEISVWMRPEDFAVDKFRRYFFVAAG